MTVWDAHTKCADSSAYVSAVDWLTLNLLADFAITLNKS